MTPYAPGARHCGPPADGRRKISARNRERLVEAAGELFAQRGYRGTTTRDISDQAGITERTLFRHYSSKADLFRVAVISPVQTFIQSFRSSWSERAPGSRSAEVEIRDFVGTLLDVVSGERQLLLALVAGLAFESHDAELPDLGETMAPLLSALDEIFRTEATNRDWDLDPVIGVRAIIGMVLALGIHADWLFGGQQHPAREDLVEQLTLLVTWGVRARPL